MMFERFRSQFHEDYSRDARRTAAGADLAVPELSEFLELFGGASFNGGLYRVVLPEAQREWNERAGLAFPSFGGRISCFGYDWMGNSFALDSKRAEDGRPAVVMLELGTGEVLEIPANLESFHEGTLIELAEAALAVDFYQRWVKSGGAKPGYLQCVGYRKALFLGGSDGLENLEICDLDVYWHVMGQVVTRTRGLAEGTVVRPTMV